MRCSLDPQATQPQLQKKIYICPKYHKMPACRAKGAGVDGKGGVEVAGDEVATRRGCNCDAVCCIKATLQIAN